MTNGTHLFRIGSVYLLILGLTILTTPIKGQQKSSTNLDLLQERADSLYENFEEHQALSVYNNILKKDSDNFVALWRASFLYSRIGYRFEQDEQQREYFNKAIELAERSLKVDSAHAHSNFVMAVGLGRKALISKAKERVAAARDIKRYVVTALEYDSTHAGAWHVLGKWHFEVANLNFAERLAANLLFGGMPKGASNEAALESIKRAVELKPDYIPYRYDLARVYEEMGQDEKAIESCSKVLNLESLTPDDPGLKKQCSELIENLQ